MTELLEENGTEVLMLDLREGVSGLTCTVRRPGSLPPVPAIVVNRRMTLERHSVERAANRFAGALLVPAGQPGSEIGPERRGLGYRELVELKRLYGISGAALLERLRDLGIIFQSTLAYAFQTFARRWRREEPEWLEAEEHHRELEVLNRFERLR